MRLAPRVARARLALGSTLMEAGRLDDAERALRETSEILPASGDARWALADVYERLDRGTDAVASLEAAAALTVMAGKAHLYWRIAQLAHGYWRDFPRVIAMVSRRTWLVLNEPHSHKDLGLAYDRAGRADEALTELLMATLLGYEDGEMLGAMGQPSRPGDSTWRSDAARSDARSPFCHRRATTRQHAAAPGPDRGNDRAARRVPPPAGHRVRGPARVRGSEA